MQANERWGTNQSTTVEGPNARPASFEKQRVLFARIEEGLSWCFAS